MEGGISMKLAYLKGLRTSRLLEVEQIINVVDDCWLVRLRAGKDLTWTPGEHGIFTLPGRRVRGKCFRAFSVASVPREGVILLGMRTGREPSDFKHKLLSFQQGDTVRMRGPFGGFVRRDSSSPVVLIARGIGITPMRALVLSLLDGGEAKGHVIHRARRHLFRDFFEQLQGENPQLTLNFPDDDQGFDQDIKHAAAKYGSGAYWYVAASPGEIRMIKRELKSLGIPTGRIITDPFYGYSRSYSASG